MPAHAPHRGARCALMMQADAPVQAARRNQASQAAADRHLQAVQHSVQDAGRVELAVHEAAASTEQVFHIDQALRDLRQLQVLVLGRTPGVGNGGGALRQVD